MGSKNKKSKKSKTPIKREEEADTSSPTSKNHVDEQQEEEGTLVGASDDIIKQEDASNQDRDDDKGRGSNEERDEENYDFDRPQEGEGAGNNANDEPKEVQGENSTKENHGDENEKKKSKLDKFLKKTENFNDKLRKRGVIYIARVPPKMTPTKVKSLLSEFGEITRVYLVEEDKAVRQRRRKQGGSGAKRYTEGWVEFAKKKVAKHVALSLNNTPISNFKRSTHYGDLWNLKYLHKFKWSHLTEKVAYERRVREQKLRVEMMQARRENANYVELVETGKKLDKIEERKRKRMEREGISDDNQKNSADGDTNEKKKKRKKKQTKPFDDRKDSATKKALLQALVQD